MFRVVSLTKMDFSRWNVRSEGSYALLSGAIISGLALLPSLSYATFGCMDQYLEVPKSLPSISTVHTLSLHIHTIGAQPDPEFLSYTMGDLASLVPMFPGIENLSIRCCDNVVFGFDTTKNIVQQALSGYLPQLKTLDLLNVPAELMFDELTTPRFTQLQTLGVFFSQPPFEPDTRLGSLPVVDKDGSTNLQSLTIHSERDGSPFHIIPRSGLRHLSLIGSLLDEDLDGMGVSFSERLDLVLSGHRKTLESLVLLPSCHVDDAWYENTMRPTLSECTQLKHFAIGVEGTFKSIVVSSVTACLRYSVLRYTTPFRSAQSLIRYQTYAVHYAPLPSTCSSVVKTTSTHISSRSRACSPLEPSVPHPAIHDSST